MNALELEEINWKKNETNEKNENGAFITFTSFIKLNERSTNLHIFTSNPSAFGIFLLTLKKSKWHGKMWYLLLSLFVLYSSITSSAAIVKKGEQNEKIKIIASTSSSAASQLIWCIWYIVHRCRWKTEQVKENLKNKDKENRKKKSSSSSLPSS